MGVTLWQFLSDRAEKMARDAFKNVNTLDEWQRIRPRRRRELMAPRKVALVNPGHCNRTWPNRVFKRLRCPERFINT